MEEKLIYTSPDVEVLSTVIESACLTVSGDGTVIGPGEEIPD